MNIAHPGHPALNMGVSAHGALGLTTPFSSSPASLHQRSPFAIQELLGLSHAHAHQETGVRTCTGRTCGFQTADASSILSAASSYIPRTLAASHEHVLSSANSAISYSAWRPSFLSPFSSSGSSPNHVSMFGLSSSHQPNLSSNCSENNNTGKSNKQLLKTFTKSFPP